jgi:hypothetical protein
MLAGNELVAVCIGSIGSALMFVAYCLINFQHEMGKYAIGERSLVYLTILPWLQPARSSQYPQARFRLECSRDCGAWWD